MSFAAMTLDKVIDETLNAPEYECGRRLIDKDENDPMEQEARRVFPGIMQQTQQK